MLAPLFQCVEQGERGGVFVVFCAQRADLRVVVRQGLFAEVGSFQQAMAAVSESLRVQDSKPYIRVYRRDDEGEYQMINLDVAKV